MTALLGHLAVIFGLVIAAGGAAVSFADPVLPGGAVWGRRAAFAVAALVSLAVGIMEYALLGHDFSVKYVAEVGGVHVPTYYTIASLWSALEGSILLWAFLLSLYTAVFLLVYGRRFPELQPLITGVLLTISSFFLLVIAGPGDPFKPVDPAIACASGCLGPNPLLQNHWMMGVHPVLLYLGYVGLSIPFAMAIASLVRGGPSPDVFRLVRRWALIPWTFLSLGIVAGMWWSYAVLGWGGYWSWDPVENVSVMPWLVTTAFLHSLQVQERRQMLKVWTMSLIIGAFLLSILGTFLTRSGTLVSVHSFTQSTIGPMFLGFFAVVLIGSLGLLFARSRELAAPGALDAVVCRETAFLVNNLLLVALTFTIMLGTLFPLLVEALQGTQLSVGGPYFNQVAVPIGVALLFLMGVGPALPWGATRWEELQYRLLAPVVVGVAIILILLLAGVRGTAALSTFGLAGFVFAVTLARVGSDVRSRHGNSKESWGRAGARLIAANPRRYGGYLAHIGILCIVIGIAASQTYQVRASVTLRPGQSMTVDGYRLRYEGYRPILQANRVVIQGQVQAWHATQPIGTLQPAQDDYVSLPTAILTPAIRDQPASLLMGLLHGQNPWPDLAQLRSGRNPFEDVYVVLEAVTPRKNGPATLQVLINPMVDIIWLGGAVLGLGGLLALAPSRRRRRAAAWQVEATQPALADQPAREEVVV